MPRGDRTGPLGGGPMTGHGAGYCAGFGLPGYANPTLGRGLRLGGGRWQMHYNVPTGGYGRGWRHQYYATGIPGWMRNYGRVGMPASYYAPGNLDNIDAERQELNLLKEQAKYFSDMLDNLNKRIDEIQNKKGRLDENEK